MHVLTQTDMPNWKIHANEHGVSVHFGSSTVLLQYEQIRAKNDIVFASKDGVTVQDETTGTRVFLPARLFDTYQLAIENMKSARIMNARHATNHTDGRTITGP